MKKNIALPVIVLFLAFFIVPNVINAKTDASSIASALTENSTTRNTCKKTLGTTQICAYVISCEEGGSTWCSGGGSGVLSYSR